MQLPRGRFHTLLKSTTPRALMEEMTSTRFTGICTIILDGMSAVLVLNEGLVVLAEYGGIRGEHALDVILKGEESEAAAELNLLTPDQLQLAREFNKPFEIPDADAGKKKRPAPSKPIREDVGPSTGTKSSPVAPGSRDSSKPAEERPEIPISGREQSTQEAPATHPSEGDDIEILIRNMEEMNIDQFISTFRVNCKDILKKIHLDHLIQDKDT